MTDTPSVFAEKLAALSERLLRLGGLVEQAIGRSVGALVNRDSDLARAVVEQDTEIDALELEVDDLCLELLALQQAAAPDLRFIMTGMKITHDLERIGDHAVNIAERALELNEEPPLPPIVDLPFMAGRAREMVRAALDAFVARDGRKAREVIRMDHELDRRMEQIFRAMLAVMNDDASTISRALRTTFVAKSFERIGDQATNICEQVVFFTEARVIKHSPQGPEDEPAPTR